MSDGQDHKVKAVDAIDAANVGMADETRVGQVYAITAVAEAMLAVYDILIEIREQLERKP
jgi:hypothetical protein